MKTCIALVVLCFFAVMFAPPATAQDGARVGSPANSEPLATALTPFAPNAVIAQGFDAVSVTPGGSSPPNADGTCVLNAALSGWFARNNASPLGTTCAFNGGAGTTFPAQSGAATSYAAMNFNSSAGSGNINTWLVTPRVNFNPGARLEFWTRATGTFADRLQVRLSTAADTGTPDVGTGNGPASTVGTFTSLLLDINPTLTATAGTCPAANITVGGATITGYPQGAWCRIVITGGALPTSGSGRIGFRYFTDNGGPAGANSNFIGIDTFSFDDGIAVGGPTAQAVTTLGRPALLLLALLVMGVAAVTILRRH
jgi:hypothetical protein